MSADRSNVVDLDEVRRLILSRSESRPPCLCGAPTRYGRWRCDVCQIAAELKRAAREAAAAEEER